MKLAMTQVDAFTAEAFKGNPAAVCVLPTPQSDAWMQAVAQEMNLSETAFLLRQTEGFELRWFTPTVEVDLCGHATLASAHVLWSEGHLPPHEVARFYTRSGLLTAQRQEDWIELNFPIDSPTIVQPPAELAAALEVQPLSVGQARLGYVVEVDSAAIVRELQPDFARLAELPVPGVMITSPADTAEYDFISRFFAPRLGINEDPVTGAAHCCLAPFWQSRFGKETLLGYQASARGGCVRVRCQGERVHLAGQAVTVLRGELLHFA